MKGAPTVGAALSEGVERAEHPQPRIQGQGWRRSVAERRSRRSPPTTPKNWGKAAHLSMRPIQVSPWKMQLLDGDSELLTKAIRSRTRKQVRPRSLSCTSSKGSHNPDCYCWLQMELECHKKISAALIVRELGQYVDGDHPVLRSSRQCALLGLPKYPLYYQPAPIRESKPRIMARIDALDLEDRCSASRRMVA